MKAYTAVIQQCSATGIYVGYVPGFPGAHSQAESLDELNANLKEVLEMLVEDGEPMLDTQFVGTQTVTVPFLLRQIAKDFGLLNSSGASRTRTPVALIARAIAAAPAAAAPAAILHLQSEGFRVQDRTG